MSDTDAAAQLFDVGEYVSPDRIGQTPSIYERFQAFHDANPWVYDALVALARDLRDNGAERIGMKMLFEIVRWQYMRSTEGEAFKLNNDFTSRYARLIMLREHDLEGIFELRGLHTP